MNPSHSPSTPDDGPPKSSYRNYFQSSPSNTPNNNTSGQGGNDVTSFLSGRGGGGGRGASESPPPRDRDFYRMYSAPATVGTADQQPPLAAGGTFQPLDHARGVSTEESLLYGRAAKANATHNYNHSEADTSPPHSSVPPEEDDFTSALIRHAARSLGVDYVPSTGVLPTRNLNVTLAEEDDDIALGQYRGNRPNNNSTIHTGYRTRTVGLHGGLDGRGGGELPNTSPQRRLRRMAGAHRLLKQETTVGFTNQELDDEEPFEDDPWNGEHSNIMMPDAKYHRRLGGGGGGNLSMDLYATSPKRARQMFTAPTEPPSELLKQIKLREKALGDDHLSVAALRLQLAEHYVVAEQSGNAEEEFLKVLDIFKKRYGGERAREVLPLLAKIATFYASIEQYSKSELYFGKAKVAAEAEEEIKQSKYLYALLDEERKIFESLGGTDPAKLAPQYVKELSEAGISQEERDNRKEAQFNRREQARRTMMVIRGELSSDAANLGDTVAMSNILKEQRHVSLTPKQAASIKLKGLLQSLREGRSADTHIRVDDDNIFRHRGDDSPTGRRSVGRAASGSDVGSDDEVDYEPPLREDQFSSVVEFYDALQAQEKRRNANAALRAERKRGGSQQHGGGKSEINPATSLPRPGTKVAKDDKRAVAHALAASVLNGTMESTRGDDVFAVAMLREQESLKRKIELQNQYNAQIEEGSYENKHRRQLQELMSKSGLFGGGAASPAKGGGDVYGGQALTKLPIGASRQIVMKCGGVLGSLGWNVSVDAPWASSQTGGKKLTPAEVVANVRATAANAGNKPKENDMAKKSRLMNDEERAMLKLDFTTDAAAAAGRRQQQDNNASTTTRSRRGVDTDDDDTRPPSEVDESEIIHNREWFESNLSSHVDSGNNNDNAHRGAPPSSSSGGPSLNLAADTLKLVQEALFRAGELRRDRQATELLMRGGDASNHNPSSSLATTSPLLNFSNARTITNNHNTSGRPSNNNNNNNNNYNNDGRSSSSTSRRRHEPHPDSNESPRSKSREWNYSNINGGGGVVDEDGLVLDERSPILPTRGSSSDPSPTFPTAVHPLTFNTQASLRSVSPPQRRNNNNIVTTAPPPSNNNNDGAGQFSYDFDNHYAPDDADTMHNQASPKPLSSSPMAPPSSSTYAVAAVQSDDEDDAQSELSRLVQQQRRERNVMRGGNQYQQQPQHQATPRGGDDHHNPSAVESELAGVLMGLVSAAETPRSSLRDAGHNTDVSPVERELANVILRSARGGSDNNAVDVDLSSYTTY